MPNLYQPAPPKCAALVDFIKSEIERCQLLPGDRLPTVSELKKRFGISNSTIAQGYFFLEQEGLVRRSQGSGVFVADNRPVRLQGVLGVMIPEKLQHHSYYSRIMLGVSRVAREEGMELLLLPESSKARWEKVDGVLLPTPSLAEFDRVPFGMPVVSLLHSVPGAASVVTDDAVIMRKMVEHLSQLGHRRIGVITGSLSSSNLAKEELQTSVNRMSGYYEAMRSVGIEPPAEWIRPLLHSNHNEIGLLGDRAMGSEAMRRWMLDGWHELGCTALIAQNDGTAVGAIDVLQNAGMRIPEDLSVVGFDGLEIAEYFRPRLTTAEVPLEEIGARGAQLLLEQVRQPLDAEGARSKTTEIPVPIVIPSRLIVGESTIAARV